MLLFGDFVLDEKQSILLCQGKAIPIDPKVFELLLIFINQPNITITRQYLLDHLWSGSIVTDNAINKLIANLRKVLEDDPKKPRYIQTIPKRGYRFICNVTLHEIPNSAINTLSSSKGKNGFRITRVKAVSFSVLLLLFSLFLWQLIIQPVQPNINRYSLELTRAQGVEKSARMHPDKKHLLYLKTNSTNNHDQLWIKNIHTAKRQQIDMGKLSISSIVSVTYGQHNGETNLIYLDKRQNICNVYQAIFIHKKTSIQESQGKLTVQLKQHNTLFDCSDKRIKDIDFHAKRQEIYYAAQPQNFWPNQIYAFDLATKKHRIVTQDEPVGWGHHSIDISPDGNKLLIMSTNSDYKTQLLALNLYNNEITQGIKLGYPVTEAIWSHDSEQVLYYAAPPLNQVIRSDFNGKNATAFISVSERLSPQMSLFPDGKNIVFTTEQKNFSNRWLVAPERVNDIDNSTVYDTNPALFHHSKKYFFISKRSGHRQLYLGHYDINQAEIVSNLSKPLWLSYLAISPSDQSVLLNVENEVYNIPVNDLNHNNPLKSLAKEQLIFTSEYPIISLDWLTEKTAAITTVKNGIPALKVVNVMSNTVQQLNGNWAYGMSDSHNPQYSYLIEQQTNTLFRANSLPISADKNNVQQSVLKTEITLPKGFYSVKIDSNVLYYGYGESDGDYLNAIPLNNTAKGGKYPLSEFNGYDIRGGTIMISDIERLEGDVHRTMD